MRRFHGATLERLQASGVTTLHVLGGYVRGTAVVALLEAVVIGVTLVALRVPLALLTLAAGAILSGIVGAVRAMPMTAVGWALVQIWFPAPSDPGAPSGRDVHPGAALLDPPGPAAPTSA